MAAASCQSMLSVDQRRSKPSYLAESRKEICGQRRVNRVGPEGSTAQWSIQNESRTYLGMIDQISAIIFCVQGVDLPLSFF